MSDKPIEIRLTNDGSHTLFLRELNESYHSHFGAVQESLYVYIQNGLEFWLDRNQQAKECRIFELGFGTGLNAMLAFVTSENYAQKFSYQVVDTFILPESIWSQLNYFQTHSEKTKSDFHRLHRLSWNVANPISPMFLIEKTENSFMNLPIESRFDLVFYDAFGPDKQPELWTEIALRKTFDLLVPGGVFVTYASKGEVRRTLERIGFDVERLAGPPGKKHMTRCVKTR